MTIPQELEPGIEGGFPTLSNALRLHQAYAFYKQKQTVAQKDYNGTETCRNQNIDRVK